MKGKFRAALIAFGFLALTLPLMPLQWILKHISIGAARWLPHAYHRLLCKLLGINIEVEGTLPNVPALLIANHTSWLDILLLSAVAPVSFIAKREVRGWPLFGAMARLQRCVFVDRSRRQTTDLTRNEIAERLKSGDRIVLFPEGTSSDGTVVLPFKSAFFGAIEGLDFPAVPITISYQGKGQSYAWYGDMELVPHLWAVLKSGPLVARVAIHPALEKSDRKTMARVAEDIVRGALHGPAKIR